MSASGSRSQRSSTGVSPFRSRKPPASKNGGRPATPSSSSTSRAPSKLSVSPTTSASPSTPAVDRPDYSTAKENVTVTVRFRPLSTREINKGNEIAWYADGDYSVRNENNSSTAYSFDRVFGPASTTRHVYDIAAQHVVSGAMEGINGTVMAYGVTSSGKTHTMHGEQKSPGIIPLAVKDVFGIIQETPGHEFLLRVSYLEIYNEVINDLLNPTGQNLRIREDSQGTYVEGIKEEVVLSPAHALSLIASGEEHRHVGSNNFNLLSSRSHTIFTLTIESSPRGGNQGEEDVTLSQLNLIDLAGSESSKTETSGLRRKEGSYINKSLLTLGTVISKLTDGKATHIPYRDSKLTRLLQSSLSGHGRVSLICNVTPASGNSEETHNTLKFAHRSKHVEIKASQNKIMDEKSLIKKYQKEISSLKQELQQLKRGMMENPHTISSTQEDIVNLRLQLEAGQVKLRSRLEEEEQAKEALMGRIQRLTKLILVSTKNAMQSSISERVGHRRRHSFGEDELAYLPYRKREYMVDDDTGSFDSELSAEGRGDVGSLDESAKDYKRNRRRGMLGWFKLRKAENQVVMSPSAESETSLSGSPASSSKSLQKRVIFNDMKDGQRKSVSRSRDDPSIVDSFPGRTQAGDLFSATVRGHCLPPTNSTITDQMDLLREQVKMLAGEVALCTSSLRRLSEQASKAPEDSQLKENMLKLKDEISEKKHQIRLLEQRMIVSVDMSAHTSNSIEMSQALAKLATQLNEKTFELEIKSADNRILQEQLEMKISENTEMQEAMFLLRRQLDSLLDKRCDDPQQIADYEAATFRGLSGRLSGNNDEAKDVISLYGKSHTDDNTPTSVMSLNRVFSQEDSRDCNGDALSNSQVLMQAAEIENLKQEKVRITEERDGLEIQCQKLAEEASYAKELAAAAAAELQNLAEEVTKLSYQNAKLASDLAAANEALHRHKHPQRFASFDMRQNNSVGAQSNVRSQRAGDGIFIEENVLNTIYNREATFEIALPVEDELGERLDEAKQREIDLENELANMQILVSKMRKSTIRSEDISSGSTYDTILAKKKKGYPSSNGFSDRYDKERRNC
ncbi:kinesin-like protein KIN-7C, mitochondrial [Malania oleifera]|uniref:kinesin-like protein KIN-7C, mitochondrial n=1 Tax=Malania oleifera TaxID=397392 RepID=UPI0025ADBE8D|nr:kinesin-like protein KIN-7C, mitochondrial [Malania oleifera]